MLMVWAHLMVTLKSRSRGESPSVVSTCQANAIVSNVQSAAMAPSQDAALLYHIRHSAWLEVGVLSWRPKDFVLWPLHCRKMLNCWPANQLVGLTSNELSCCGRNRVAA